jgi:hypothetical protein
VDDPVIPEVELVDAIGRPLSGGHVARRFDEATEGAVGDRVLSIQKPLSEIRCAGASSV